MSDEKLEDRITAAAKEQGWREDGELDAFEFIKNGSQYHRDLKTRVDSLSSENAKVYGIVAEHILNQKQKEFVAETSSVKAQIKEAADAGDADKVLRLTDDLQKIKAPEPVADPNFDVVDTWAKENKEWFNVNKDMTADAKGFYQAEKERLGSDDPKVILPKVKARIEKEYGDYFKPKNPNREQGSSGDSGTRTKPARRGELSSDDLDEDERMHIAQFKELGLSEEKMLKSIANLRKQRGV